MRKVLVVDAASSTRQRLCNWLVELGGVAAMGCPAAADEVLRTCAEFAPDSVLIDIPLHDGEVFGLIAAIRRLRSSARIVLLSNEVTPELVSRGLAAGADHTVSKAFEFETVLHLVRTNRFAE